ncbi:hypothetical protein GN958_ATG19847 [Phytophthora infestans]|uniref:Crinkler (CRN) family protein n=1 Tax=Phytophthora infestans TaxID=4787 RepID=A0A8S9TWJ0_PHYIN|nr:hypothetical protein GN958_ATG19847 [Phytophthora infestans]
MDDELEPFHFLATSCQYDAKHDDSARVVVLPAWRQADLLTFAQQTNWVIDTGLREVMLLLKGKTFSELAGEQYYYSGGSLREFCKTRDELQSQVVDDCAAVENDQAFQLIYNYGGDKAKSQMDRLRRHCIDDCTNEEHYMRRIHWRLTVDSGYALRRLGKNISMAKQLEIYTYARSIGAGFHGVAFELLLHSAVQYRKSVVLKMREGSVYEKIEIRVPHIACGGETEKECLACLITLEKDTYWHPDYPFFYFIDAVTTCEAFRSGIEGSETVVAYIQVTISSDFFSRKQG